MEFFLQYKTVIFRTLGTVMFVVGLALYFWVTPKEALSENEKAAQRIARMEAAAKGTSKAKSDQSTQKDNSKFLESMKETQAKQLEYMMLLVIVLGAGFMIYSFLPKKQE